MRQGVFWRVLCCVDSYELSWLHQIWIYGLFFLWDGCHCWARLDFVFFPGCNASFLKCCPANSTFLAERTWGQFHVHFNPDLCLSALQTALSHSCCLGCHQHLSLWFWPAVWCTCRLSTRIKAGFLSKDCSCVNLIKRWSLKLSLIQVNVNLVFSEWIDPFKERLTSGLWLVCGLRWNIFTAYWKICNQQTLFKHTLVLTGFFCVQMCDCV